MRCLNCDYKLDHLRTTRCPECGHAFDPLLSETFRQDKHGWQHYFPRHWVLLAMFFVMLVNVPIIVPHFTEAHEHMEPAVIDKVKQDKTANEELNPNNGSE